VIIMRLKPIIAIAAFAGALCYAQSPVQLKVVKTSPFSAQAATQSIQDLADGNRISHERTALIARDSEGRTRREESSIVYIQDPVAGSTYVLDSNSRVAIKIAVPQSETAQPSAESKLDTSPDFKSESLGSQFVEDLQVDGTRITRTIASGQSGNEKPIVVSMETWYSTDLQTIVMSRTLDPRLGETVYKLTNIDRTEPSHSLFEVPSDYTVREALQSGKQ
jgi:hypothetical protein